jgi:glycosyltransferase A (GT-A) superfamily protein (DUF2064 family)
MQAAAELAAAALLDTLETCRATFGAPRCVIALTGDLKRAERGAEIRGALADWRVIDQRGDGFAERLANAHLDCGPGPILQLGMDTPQVSADLLEVVSSGLRDHPAILAPTYDGGWWALALADPRHAHVLAGVPMSTAETGQLTRSALEGVVGRVGVGPRLRDVDTVADAAEVATGMTTRHFRAAWLSTTTVPS